MSLLQGFYKPSSGVVLLDDVEYNTIDPGYIRANIGFVTQVGSLLSPRDPGYALDPGYGAGIWEYICNATSSCSINIVVVAAVVVVAKIIVDR